MHAHDISMALAGPPDYIPASFGEDPVVRGALFAHMLLGIATIVVLIPSLKSYAGSVSFLAWDASRPIWSVLWSIALIGLALFSLYDAVRIARLMEGMFWLWVGTVGFKVLLLVVRAQTVGNNLLRLSK